MKELKPEEGLKLFDIKWRTDTAGPSPNNNERIEVFLLGCDKAMLGNPCKGCFNSITWNKNKAEFSWDPIELANMINKGCDPNNKYITIGGGEPTDQIDKLIPFVQELKKYGFHIMMYTWRNLERLLRNHPIYVIPSDFDFSIPISRSKMKHLLKYLDIVVDGQFDQEECLYQQKLGDGMLSSIGSGNQCIYDIKYYNETGIMTKYHMRDLVGLHIKPDTKDLVYITKE